MNGQNRNRYDLSLLLISRSTRSFAAGFLAVIIGLYYTEGLHLSLTEVGILFAAGGLGTPLLTLIFGRLADIHGRKKLLLASLILLPLSIVILLVTTNYAFLIVSSALGGFGIAGGLVGGGVGGSVAPMQSALLAEKTDAENRTTLFSIFTMISSFAGSAGALMSNIEDYRLLFLIALVITAISVVSIIPLKENFKRKRINPEKGIQKKGNASPNRNIIAKFAVTGTMNGAAQGLITPFLSIILAETFLMPNGEIGDLFAVGGFLTALVMIFTPILTKRMGFVPMIISTRSVSTVFLLAFPFASSALMASFFYVIFTSVRALSLPSQQALMMTMVTEETRASATGINQSARLFPSAAASASSGAIQDYISVVIPFEISFVLNIANLLMYYKFFWNEPAARAGYQEIKVELS
ncbi:MAG: MFS transporter [Thermoplasmataceae archaeon]